MGASTGTGARAARDRLRRRRRRRRIRSIALLAIVVLLSPEIYSYATTMARPSSLPLWPRSVEWLRAHHGNWLVDEVEHYYYSWKAPKKGGPQLKSLPRLGLGTPLARQPTTIAQHKPALSPTRIR